MARRRNTGKGWFNESRRHSLASKGIKTAHKTTPSDTLVKVSKNRFKGDNPFEQTINMLDGAGLTRLDSDKDGNPDYLENTVEIAQLNDSDGDGVPNLIDCDPYDPKKQHTITSIKGADRSKLAREIRLKLNKKGYDAVVELGKGKSLNVRRIRVVPKKRGYNVSSLSGRKTRVLTWDEWVEINGIINNVLDKNKVKANIKSLGGKFVIRDKNTGRKSEEDWEHLKYENVGSQMNPIQRADLYTKARSKFTGKVVTK